MSINSLHNLNNLKIKKKGRDDVFYEHHVNIL